MTHSAGFPYDNSILTLSLASSVDTDRPLRYYILRRNRPEYITPVLDNIASKAHIVCRQQMGLVCFLNTIFPF